MRNVTSVLKFRVAGCAHRDMDNKTSEYSCVCFKVCATKKGLLAYADAYGVTQGDTK